MVFMWYVSSYNKSCRKVILDTDIGDCGIDQITEDINALILMGLEHGASETSVVVPIDISTNAVSISFDFPNDNTWKNFCKAFLKDNSNKSKAENEE